MALVSRPPSRIAFFCDTPSAAGGETSILSSAALVHAVRERQPAFCERLKAEGLVYLRTLSEQDDPSSAQGRGWRSTYAPDGSRESAEAAMRATGVASWEWLADGGLRTKTAVLPAFGRFAGQELFHNALAAVYLGWTDVRNAGPECVRFGETGDALPRAEVEAVAAAMAGLAVNIPWQRGDVMLLDNRLAMHARRPFAPPRRVLAYICE
jgi:hypothetical protein